MDYFKDKVVLVTGSARGIGLAALDELCRRGARGVVSDILEVEMNQAVSRLQSSGLKVHAFRADVTDAEQCEALVRSTIEQFGRLDILINNAGISIVDELANCRANVCRKLIEVNLIGSINMTLAALPELKKSRGHVIFLSSVSGIRAIPTGSIYSCSKAALRSFAESIRLELKPHGVHVGVISPGFTTTDAAKTVMKGDGAARPIDRPPHDTPEGVAKGIAKLIEGRKREIVLTPLGKATFILQRISPTLLDLILQGRELKN